MKRAILCTVFSLIFLGVIAEAEQPWYDLPELPPPYQYGNILITRSEQMYNMPSVSFSHWRHRLKYTCRVCHLELGFEMKVNATEVTEEKNKNGEFCGACHDGKVAFGHTKKHCSKCHNGNISYGRKYFKGIAKLPKNRYGNRINWSKAIRRRLIRPKQSIFDDDFTPIPFDKKLELSAEWSMIPPAIFPHKAHARWLDCANCHPDIFKIKKKGTKHFLMNYILEGKFCGVCHINVAFPMDDCDRCHPKIRKKL
jgi:c(7)-type cytochrome triheme protein